MNETEKTVMFLLAVVVLVVLLGLWVFGVIDFPPLLPEKTRIGG
jgi:hypothetical protein